MLLPTERILGEGGVTKVADALKIDIRLPWYRSLPASTVRINGLEIDGAAVPLEQLSFELEGRRWPVGQMAELTHQVWFILDSAYLVAPSTAKAGDTVEIALNLTLSPPYIAGMNRVSRESASLIVQASSTEN